MPEDKISVLLVDDHILVRRGFRRLLEDDESIEVVGEAGDVATLPAQTEQVVVPSAICAPHMLQKAIKVSSRLLFGVKGAACRLRATAAK